MMMIVVQYSHREGSGEQLQWGIMMPEGPGRELKIIIGEMKSPFLLPLQIL